MKIFTIVVVISIILNLVLNIFYPKLNPLENSVISDILYSSFDQIRYGHYLFRKWFITICAFLILGIWAVLQKKSVLRFIKNNLGYILIIYSVALIARINSFNHWFYADDIRIISDYFGFYSGKTQFLPCCLTGNHSLAALYLLVQLFGNNFLLYKIVGIVLAGGSGLVLYLILHKLFNNRLISLLGAIFFITTPTYFQEAIATMEITGDMFTFLLFLTSAYLLLQRFFPGAVIFMVASLQFGLSRSNLILPVLLLLLFFFLSKKFWSKGVLIFVLGYLSLLPEYLIVFPTMLNSGAASIPGVNQILIAFHLFLWATIPAYLVRTFLNLTAWFIGDHMLIPPFLGAAVIVTMILYNLRLYHLNKVKQAKLFFLGWTSIFFGIVGPTLSGTRVTQDITKLFVYNKNVTLPPGETAYTLFSAFGLTMVFTTLVFIVLRKGKVGKIIAVLFIIMNIFAFLRSDYLWTKLYAEGERTVNKQLGNILSPDNDPVIIYTHPTDRFLWQGSKNFNGIFQATRNSTAYMEENEFLLAYKSKKVPKDHFYFLSWNDSTQTITDLSERLRSGPDDKIDETFKVLIDEAKKIE